MLHFIVLAMLSYPKSHLLDLLSGQLAIGCRRCNSTRGIFTGTQLGMATLGVKGLQLTSP
jgi:hypothetical protein